MFLWLKLWRLSQRLGSNYTDVKETAIHDLVEIGKPAVPRLLKALRNGDRTTRQGAAEALGKIGDTRAVEGLVARLNDYPPYVAMKAVAALARIGDKRAVPPLIAKLNDENISYQVISALGEIRDPSCVDSLVLLLTHDSYRIRDRAAEVLALIGDTRAIAHLERYFSANPSKAIAQSLQTLNWQPTSVHYRVLRAITFGHISDASAEGSEALETLIPLLKGQSQEIKEAVAEALGNIGNAQVFEPLMQALKTQSLPNAYAVIGKLGDRRALPFLLNLLSHGDEYRKEQAMEGLGYLGEPEAAEALFQVLSGANSFKTLNGYAQEHAANALERILAKSSKGVSTAVLHQLASVKDPLISKRVMRDADDDYYSKTVQWNVDCSQLRRLASEELIRRG